jgi:16S rRNA processing protein RimM
MSDDSSALIQLGVVGAPFGVRGWIKLRSHTDPPDQILQHRTLRIGRDESWVEYRIEERGRSGGVPTAKLAGIEDRDQAAGLRGAAVWVLRTELPKPEAKDFYRTDLIGCAVVNLSGLELGKVLHFVETSAQALMVIRGEREYWVPAVPQHLKKVDLAARRIVVDWDASVE